MVRKTVLCGTPTLKPDHRFLSCITSFIFEASKKFDLSYKMVVGKPIYEADNELAREAIRGNFDYLLFIEDDHYEFRAEDLEKMISFDLPVVAIPYYSRHFPYQMTCMKLSEQVNGYGAEPLNIYEPIESKGLKEVDLTGFGFTLIKTEILRLLSNPLFYPTEYCSKATDQWFYRKLKNELNIKPFAWFDRTLPHREITKDNVELKRIDKIENCSMFARNSMLKKFGNPRIKKILKKKSEERFGLSK